ncbi:MAG: glycosyltransferase [Oligoflexales bacterium]|nr:glycosyltransferase [Oligoflexales bacterium]
MFPAEKNIAVILPAYNEETTIGEVICAFHEQLPGAGIFVINNNSSDRTSEIAIATFNLLGCRGYVINEPLQGKGNALRRAFKEIDADIYVLSDADQTYPAECVREMIVPVLEDRADMVVGDRHTYGVYSRENKRSLHVFGNALVLWLVNFLFGARLTDIMSGYRVFNRRFIKNYPILVRGFEIETDMTLHSLHRRFRILEIPVEYRDRPLGSYSKLKTFSDGAKVIFTIAQILRYYRPLFFFLCAAMFFAIAGFITGIPVFQDWIRFHYIYHVPLAILASSLEIVAVLFSGVGLILDSVAHKERMSYELHLLSEDRFFHLEQIINNTYLHRRTERVVAANFGIFESMDGLDSARGSTPFQDSKEC